MSEQIAIQNGEHVVTLEYVRIQAEEDDVPIIVFLHEGLGSLSMWSDWPERLCRATNMRGLVFSRYGYGNSSPRPDEPWPIDYLEHEAKFMLPALFAALDITPDRDKVILFGHSDGGTIALLYAAAFPAGLSAAIVLAPHEFVEEMGTQRIAHLQRGFSGSELAKLLAQHHTDPSGVFSGWSELWLSERYQDWSIEHCLSVIACPLLVVQGEQDQYGTVEQVNAIVRAVPHATSILLESCRHIPHQEQPDTLLQHVKDFFSAYKAVLQPE